MNSASSQHDSLTILVKSGLSLASGRDSSGFCFVTLGQSN